MNMRISEDELRKLGYREQKDGTWSKDSDSSAGKVPKLESDSVDAVKAKNGSKKRNAKPSVEDYCRYRIVVTAYYRRHVDPDNICPKWFIDSLTGCGIIPDDSSRFVKEFIKRVVKIDYNEQEKTEIEVYELR